MTSVQPAAIEDVDRQFVFHPFTALKHHEQHGGRVMVAGIAWAQHRGIERVEVQIDDAPWQVCRIAADPTIDSWRQWAYEWSATPGRHTIQVRATDQTGETQTSQVAGVVPNGASGYDSILVTIS